MRDRTHRRSLVRDRWRNLLHKIKAHHHQQQRHSPSLSFVGDAACGLHHFQQDPIQSIPKDMESSNLNLEIRMENEGQSTRMDNEGQSTSPVMPQECHLQNGRSTWSWRDSDCADVAIWDSGMDCHPAMARLPSGRVIIVKSGDMSRKVGIDGSADAIKDAIRSAFGLRSKRSFWLEDEDGTVRSFDRTMPQTIYTLHTDPGNHKNITDGSFSGCDN